MLAPLSQLQLAIGHAFSMPKSAKGGQGHIFCGLCSLSENLSLLFVHIYNAPVQDWHC